MDTNEMMQETAQEIATEVAKNPSKLAVAAGGLLGIGMVIAVWELAVKPGGRWLKKTLGGLMAKNEKTEPIADDNGKVE